MAVLFLLGRVFEVAELEIALPAQPEINLLLLAGVLGTVAHLMMTWSLRYAPTSTLASMQYLEIPLAVLVGWLFFAELPNAMATCGILLTVAAGLYAVMRERNVSRAARLSAAQQAQSPPTATGLPASPE